MCKVKDQLINDFVYRDEVRDMEYQQELSERDRQLYKLNRIIAKCGDNEPYTKGRYLIIRDKLMDNQPISVADKVFLSL